MAHIMVRKYQTKTGLKWTATEATWDNSKNGSIEKKIDSIALQALGFSEHMTPDQAKAHAKKLNALRAVERKEQSSKIKAGERLTDLITIEKSIIPAEDSESFIIHLKENWFGGDYNLRKQILHWNLVQEILTELRLQPHDFFKKQKDFYKYFERNKMSKSYVEKIVKVINQWGEFSSEKNKTYFKKLPNPKGNILDKIVQSSDADGEGATPLTSTILMRMHGRMPPGQWEYLRATLWLGLRPSELDTIIKDPSKYKLITKGDVKIISIYQAKLVTIPEKMRWKKIPLIHPEMISAVKDIEEDRIKKPLVKTIQKAAPKTKGLGLYSGRKGFTDLMLSYNQKLENIAAWMGHSSIQRTWKHYKNKNLIDYTPIDSVMAG